MQLRLLSALLALAVAAPAAPASPLALAPHPRLIVDAKRLAAIKGFIATSAQAAAYYAALVKQGDYVLSTKPFPRPPENASDILMAARTELTRVTVTALLYRLTGDERYAARVVAELLSFTSWLDWDLEKHALDAGELSLAAAIGLDWTHDFLSDPSRSAELAAITSGIIAKSAEAFRAAYEAGAHGASWWTCDASNWAVVTNGGCGAAVLAVIGEAGVPAWVEQLLANATAGVRCSAAADAGYGGGFAPDGAWWEGPIYAGYTDRYFVPFVSALETATGSDGGFFELPGVNLSARYQMHVLGPAPAFAYFNWADASEGQETLAMLLRVADRAGDAAAAFTLRERLDAAAPGISIAKIDEGSQDAMEFAHALIYFTDLGTLADREKVPLDLAIPDKKLALLRSSWSDADASFVGLKACNCSWNHGDLDAGSFVYSWGGERWVSDLGADSYGLPAYFGSDRFTYYRKNSLGHSTLSFANATQVTTDCGGDSRPGPKPDASSVTFLESFGSRSGAALPAPAGHPLAPCAPADDEQSCATIDLAPAYQGQGVTAVSRRFALRLDGALRVQDRWSTAAAVRVAAALQTYADVAVAPDAKSALLTRGGRSLTVSLESAAACAGASFTATAVRLPPPFDPTAGLTRLDVVGVAGASCSGFDVLLAGKS